MLLSSSYSNKIYFPQLFELSIPAIFGMYIIPFIMAVTLFSFVFKKDSVDFINSLPLKRSTIYITNIIGGILLFFFIFSVTSLFMWLFSNFFDNLVIPKMMYFHYFITFFIAYVYVFITSALTLTLTGSRVVNIALTLILLFLPGFIGDFYTSFTYDNKNYYEGNNDSVYPICREYGVDCEKYQISNDFIIKKSYKMDNEQTLPYKYINTISRASLGMYNNEVNYRNEITSVYNLPSIIKMIILSIIYFILGFYFFNRRKMEIAEMTFKSENIHQFVKCITLLPLSLAAISAFKRDSSSIGILIFGAIILIIYIVYDLITRRNNTHFMKSVLYFVSFILATILMNISFSGIANAETSKKINKDDISNIGIDLSASFNYDNNYDFHALNFKIYDNEIIDLIFNNANKLIEIDNQGHHFAVRLTLKNGNSYYFNIRLPKEEADKLFKVLDSKKDYVDNLKHIDYDKIYGVRVGINYYNEKDASKIIDLIRDSYEDKTLTDIVNSTYVDYNYYGDDITSVILYIYNKGIKNYMWVALCYYNIEVNALEKYIIENYELIKQTIGNANFIFSTSTNNLNFNINSVEGKTNLMKLKDWFNLKEIGAPKI
jgi:ABC-2 type transport system permease protein